nr:hypothetical protein [uncultured Flavobacterium sp.]
MTQTRFVGYILYTLLALFLLSIIIPIGDHNFNGYSDIGRFLIFVVFTLTFLVVLGRDFYKIYKKKGTLSRYPLVVFLIVCLSGILVSLGTYGKFWTSVYAEGEINYSQYHKEGALVLFKNGSFQVRLMAPCWARAYSGDYEIKNDTLILLRPDLIKITDGSFCNKYKMNARHSLLTPLQKGFPEVPIH